jgi:uncharacterized protein (DUF433 family)
MVASSAKLLGIGLYTPAEAALYARVSTRLLNRWLYGSPSGDPVLRPQLTGEPERMVTFLDFVQAMAIRAIRIGHKVPLKKIRQAIDKAENRYGLSYPFARPHLTYLFDGEIVIKLGDDYVEASGKGADNLLLGKVVELYMKDLTFGRGGLAESYRAYVWDKTYEISMNPKMRFGEPIVVSCGYSARALWEALQSEGSMEAAAEAYGVQPAEVEAASRYYDHILGVTAA